MISVRSVRISGEPSCRMRIPSPFVAGPSLSGERSRRSVTMVSTLRWLIVSRAVRWPGAACAPRGARSVR